MTTARDDDAPPSEASPEPSSQTAAREYTLEEVAALVGMTARNVRAYQQRQLLPPALRRGRRVTYSYEHVTRARLVRALVEHGLSLKQVHQLVERGTAASELARLGREQATPPPGRSARVPMNPANVAWFEENRPGTIDRLAEAGLVDVRGGTAMASAAGLGLTSALVTRGYDLQVATEVALSAARATPDVADALLALHAAGPDTGEASEEDLLVMVQLAATAFGDSLRERVLRGS